MGHGVQLPAHMQGAGRQVGPDLDIGHAEEADYRQVAQDVEHNAHEFSPVGRDAADLGLQRGLHRIVAGAATRLGRCFIRDFNMTALVGN